MSTNQPVFPFSFSKKAILHVHLSSKSSVDSAVAPGCLVGNGWNGGCWDDYCSDDWDHSRKFPTFRTSKGRTVEVDLMQNTYRADRLLDPNPPGLRNAQVLPTT